jgi:hypothetical protein
LGEVEYQLGGPIVKKIMKQSGTPRRTVDIAQVWVERLRRNRFIAALVVVTAVLGGISQFTDYATKLTGILTKLSSTSRMSEVRDVHKVTGGQAIKIVPPSSLASDPSAVSGLNGTEVRLGPNQSSERPQLIEDPYFRIAQGEEQRYLLMVRLTARFLTEKFNEQFALSSLSDLKVLNGDLLEWKAIRDSPNPLSRPSSEWRLYLKFKAKPSPSTIVKIQLGPHRDEFRLGSHDWMEFPIDSSARPTATWWGAVGELATTVRDPDWVMLRSARLLRGEGNQSILQVTIDNRSLEAVSLDTLVLGASHPAPDRGVSCEKGDRAQELRLSWAKVIEQSPLVEAWTTIEDVKISVPVKYSSRGVCSGFYFRAAVPISAIVPPTQILRYTLRVLEFPTASTGRARSASDPFASISALANGPPAALTAWKSVSVAMSPSAGMFPSSTEVEIVTSSSPN